MKPMEMIEVLNSDGTPTGETKNKPDIHRDGDWHRSAFVWIVTPTNYVLMQRRSLAKENYPGFWDVSAAGHVAAGESAEEAAVRETLEELGLAIDGDQMERVATLREDWNLNDGTYIDREILEVFLVRRAVQSSQLTLQVGEVDEAVLMHLDSLKRHVENRDPSLVPHWEQYDIMVNRLRRG